MGGGREKQNLLDGYHHSCARKLTAFRTGALARGQNCISADEGSPAPVPRRSVKRSRYPPLIRFLGLISWFEVV